MLKPTIFRKRLLLSTGPLALLFAISAYTCADQLLTLSLSGDAEVPPIVTTASGTGRIIVREDHLVSGSISVSGIEPTVMDICEAATGETGLSIVTLAKHDDATYAVPQDTKLTEDQYKSFLAGNLYVNVHSSKYPDGEIRAQLTAKP